MSSRNLGRHRAPLIALFALIFFSSRLNAQQSGHYLQGITGLDNGTAPPPGIYLTYAAWVNTALSFQGPQGNTLEDLGLNIGAHNIVFQVTTRKKFLGAYYGFSSIVSIVNSRVVTAVPNPTSLHAGLSDVYISPVALGWENGKANYLLNYGFYAPTGNFDPSKSLNPGLGFWEHQIQAGISYSFDKRKLWNASALSTWELNQSKNGLDLRPGPMLNVEYGLGHRFDKHKINVGATGYTYNKLSSDSGAEAVRFGSLALDRSYGIGPEFKYINPMKHFAFNLRYERQFAVESKTQGNVFVAGLTWLEMFSPGHAAHN
jgi:hypothetical protein